MKRITLKQTIRGGLLLAVAAVVALAGFSQTPASAQQAQESGQALEIAPPVISLRGNPGETLNTEIILRDVSDSPLIVTNQINDFVAGGEDGTPKLLLDDTGVDNPYSMQTWFSPVSELTLEPRTVTRLPIAINIPANASPGGYFAVIRFTGTAPQVDGSGVGLSASLGSLIFVDVNGDAKEEVSIEEFSTVTNDKHTAIFQSAPVDFVLRFNNTGNTFEQPTGQISITDMFGKKVANVNVNLEKKNILPGSIRKFVQPLDSAVIGNKILFGMYTAEAKISYGSNNQVLTEKITFWVIPYTLIGIALAVLVAGFIALRFMIRRYNDHIIGKATGVKKTKSKKRKR